MNARSKPAGGSLAARRTVMRALLESFVPAAAALDTRQLQAVLERTEALVASRPPEVGRRLQLALGLIGLLARLRYFTALSTLDPSRRRQLLSRLQDSRVPALRLAVWGWRTVLFAGYYGDIECQRRLGYHPHADGWAAAGRQERGCDAR